MASLLPSLEKESRIASLLCFGYDPDLTGKNPYEGAKGNIREALAKFACLGGDYRTARLSFQEYFERPVSPETWGKPAAALLGALEAQLILEIPAIGGKDSMSGNYRDAARGIDITVPPTFVAFAAGIAPAAAVRSGALSGKPGNFVVLLSQCPANVTSEWDIFKANMASLAALGATGCVRSAYPVAAGGVAVSLALAAFGNNTGVEAESRSCSFAAGPGYQGSVLVEIDGAMYRENSLIGDILKKAASWEIAAVTIEEPVFRITEKIDGKPCITQTSLEALRRIYEQPLAKVYPEVSGSGDCDSIIGNTSRKQSRSSSNISRSSPLVILPVFPGTNCEWDMERAFRKAGAKTRQVVFRNRNGADIAQSKKDLAAAISEGQILALSGGFGAGDEPDGSGKFIANVLRSPIIADAVNDLLERRDGLILGICNGFQALIKLGLVPYGTYRNADAGMPTLTFNRIGRHVSRMVRTKVMSTASPWLALEEPDTIHILPVSHGEGRLVINRSEAEGLFKTGQIPLCYSDSEGIPALEEPDNPNGSDFAIEALTSPDGRILGKMGHSERRGQFVHVNIPGNKTQRIFEAGVKYFS